MPASLSLWSRDRCRRNSIQESILEARGADPAGSLQEDDTAYSDDRLRNFSAEWVAVAMALMFALVFGLSHSYLG